MRKAGGLGKNELFQKLINEESVSVLEIVTEGAYFI
jgi:hypothetical protein